MRHRVRDRLGHRDGDLRGARAIARAEPRNGVSRLGDARRVGWQRGAERPRPALILIPYPHGFPKPRSKHLVLLGAYPGGASGNPPGANVAPEDGIVQGFAAAATLSR